MGWLFGRKRSIDPQTDSAPVTEVVVDPPALVADLPEPERLSETAPVKAHVELAVEPEPDPAAAQPVSTNLTPEQALADLKAGNEAFLRGENNLGHVRAQDLEPLQAGQHPIATIVGCADSRTPPTILFNQGFGRLFSIRVAGNTVDTRGLASIVYAVKHLHCPLVVVMGHSGCGAVGAAEAVIDGRMDLDPSLEAMIVPIIPPVLAARREGGDPIARNASWVAQKLETADAALADAVEAGTLKIVAAVKHMDSGRVEFLDT